LNLTADLIQSLTSKTFYIHEGKTADGKDYWKHTFGAAGKYAFYLHHEPDCNGPAADDDGAMWVVTGSKPSTTALSDLDRDNECAILAYAMSDASSPPSGEWFQACKGEWNSTNFTFTDVGEEMSSSVSLVSSALTLAHVALALAFLA